MQQTCANEDNEAGNYKLNSQFVPTPVSYLVTLLAYWHANQVPRGFCPLA